MRTSSPTGQAAAVGRPPGQGAASLLPTGLMASQALLMLMLVSAQPGAKAEQPPAAAPPDPTLPVLEATRRAAVTTTDWLARGVDSWFGGKPFEEGGKVSNGRVSLSVFKRQDERADFGLRFTARFRLPNVEQHSYLFLGRDDRREVVTDQPEAFKRQQWVLSDRAAEPSLQAGLGVLLRDAVDLRLGLGAGLKPYAQARYQHGWAVTPQTRIDFRETLFWARDDQFGSTTALSFDHALSSTLAARWLSSATITQVTRRFDWSSSLGGYQSLGHQRLLTLELLLSGSQDSGVGVSDYGLQARWEQPIYQDWLLVEVLGGHFWPRRDPARERSRAWAVGGSLKMRF